MLRKRESGIGYNQSNALTSAVNKNGSGTQNHSGHTTKNPIVTNKETKKYTQYVFVLVADAMVHIFIRLQMYVIIYKLSIQVLKTYRILWLDNHYTRIFHNLTNINFER